MSRLPRRFARLGSGRFKRLGAFAILFFTIKGLLWLLVPLLIMFWGFLGF